MNSKPESLFTRRRVSAAVMSALLAGQSVAGPIGWQVVGGSGRISQSGATTTINQSTQNMAINWQSYNVNADERVQYIQPNSTSISLNRILSNNGSIIAGRIDANGQVILVNPNGVFFTPTSVVNVGGIIASGLDIAPSDFMNGNYIFNEVLGSDGKVVNSGTINASLGGNVALIGKQVENDGLIVANLGTVSLAAGKQAVLTFDNGGLLGVRVSKEILQDELGVDPAVMNGGDIHAEGGRVLLTASTSQDVFSQAVNTAGMDQATSVVVNEDGSFTLGGGADVVNSGTIDTSTASSDQGVGRIVLLGENVTSSGELHADAASGNGGDIELHAQDTTLLTGNSVTSARAESQGVGGTVKVLGDKVGLFDAATVDVSGANGGGQALIGGDYQGSNPAVRNARRTLVAPNAQIYSDALEQGDGGKIISWSDESTWFYGSAYSRGGAAHGNGGLVEISGKGLGFNGKVDTTAKNGSVGTVLFDPTNIVVIAGSAGTNDSSLSDPFAVLLGTIGGNFEISESKLESLNASTSITLQATNDITINLLSDGVLNLQSTSGSIITFTADWDGDGVGKFTMKKPDTIRTQGGSIAISGADVTAGNLVTTGASDRVGGAVSITSTGGISVQNIDTRGGTVVTNNTAGKAGGDVTLTAGTGITVAGSIDTSASDALGDVAYSDAPGNAGAIKITASGGTADVDLGGVLTANGGNGPYEPGSSSGDDGSGSDGGLISIRAGQDILISSGAAISSNGGNGPIVGSSSKSYGNGGNGGVVTLDAGRDISVNAAISSSGGDASNSTRNDISVYGNGGDAGGVTVTAGGNLSLSGSVTSLGGAANPHSGNSGTDGDISFNGSAADNTFNINDDITLAGLLVSVNGNGGNDQLVRGGTVATTNAWTIDGANSGTLAFANNASGTTTIAFNTIASLTGGAGQDDFVLDESTGGLTGLIDGGDGTGDTLKIINSSSGITVQLGNRAIGDAVADSNLNVTGIETITADANSVSSNEIRGDDIANTWTIDGSGSSVAPTSGGSSPTVQFSNFGILTAGNQGDTFAIDVSFDGTINGGTGNDAITIGASGSAVDVNAGAGDDTIDVAGAVSGLIDGGIGNDIITIESGGSAVDVSAGAGDDTIYVAGTVSGLIDGGADGTTNGDTLTITATGNKTVQLGDIDSVADYKVINIETLTGDASYQNTLYGDDSENTWTVDGASSGNVNGAIAFTNFSNLAGGAGNDTFNVSANIGSISTGDGAAAINTVVVNDGAAIYSINGGTGVDSITVNGGVVTQIATGDQDDVVTVLGGSVGSIDAGAGSDSVILASPSVITTDVPTVALWGGAGNDTLKVDTAGNTWSLTTATDGTVSNTGVTRAFEGFENLASAVGAADTLDYSDVSSAINVDLNNLTGIGTLIGNNGGSGLYDSTVTGWNTGTNNWSIGPVGVGPTDGVNDGSVTNGTDSVTFIDFNRLNGGVGSTDHFVVGVSGSITGGINGGGGTDNSLAGRNAATDWYVTSENSGVVYVGNTADAYVNSFSNIQSLIGGDGDDVFTVQLGGSVTSISTGGATVENSVDVQTGGVVSGNITGGADDDTMTVAGTVGGAIDGGAGSNDSLTITRVGDQIVHISPTVVAGADFSVTGFETLNANNGATGNTLRADGDNTWTVDAANAGNINGNSFVNFANLVGGDGNDDFTVQADGSVASLSTGDVAQNSVDVQTGGAVSGNITGGTGNDTMTVTGTVGGVIDGGTGGSDSLFITRATNQIVHISPTVVAGADFSVTGFETLNANNGAAGNTLRADGNNTWTVDAANAGNINGNSFVNFANLVGGDGNDAFTVQSGGSVASLSTGGAVLENTVNVQTGGAVSGNITGGTGNDTMTVAGTVGGVIDGGAGGNDSLLITRAGDQIVHISPTVMAGADFSVTGFETLDASNGATGNTLRADGTNTWTVDSDNAGNINGNGFVNFANLVGGDGNDTFTVNAAASIGSIASGAGVDYVSINGSAGSINSGAGSDTVTVSGTVSGVIDGGADSDTLNITRSGDQIVHISPTVVAGADFSVTGFETLDASNGAAGNTLRADGTNTWTVDGANAGNINGNGFVNFANLVGGDGNDTFTVNAMASIGSIASGAGVDYVSINGSAGSINSGAGSDTVTVSGTVSGVIDGGADSDTLNITRSGDQIVHISPTVVAGADFSVTGFETLNASNGATGNTLRADGTNTWTVDAANAGNINGNGFVNFANLVGGDGNDTFAVQSGGAVSGNITGGAGNDTMTVAGTVGGVIDGGTGSNDSLLIARVGDQIVHISPTVMAGANFSVTGFESIDASNGATGNTLRADGTNTWIVDAANAGNINSSIDFAHFANLTGGAGTDTFNFESGAQLSGLINGGAGANTLNVNSTTPTTVRLVDASPTAAVSNSADTLTVYQIGTVNGSTSTSHTLVGPDVDNNVWTVDDVNSGKVTFGASTSRTTVIFENMSNLTGGSGTDRFNLSSSYTPVLVTGLISGGDGTGTTIPVDVLDTSGMTGDAASVVVKLGSNVRDDQLNVNGVESIIGNNGLATLIAADVKNDWEISGANSGTIKPNNSDLISFSSFKNLQGGEGDDNFIVTYAGKLPGIDGGGQVVADTIDYSGQDEVEVNFGSTNFNGIAGIEGVVGNGANSTLFGPDSGAATWTINDANSGHLTAGGETLTFRGFNYLSGGDGDDTFVVSGNGSLGYTNSNNTFIPGLITGGGGTNELNVELSGANAPSAQVDYVGTGTSDTINIADSSSNAYTLAYTPSVSVSDGNNSINTGNYSQLKYHYTNNSSVDTSFAVNYRGVGSVASNQKIASMTVNAPAASGEVSLGNGVVQVGTLTPVNYTNATDMTVAAAGNTIQLNGINLPGVLTLTGISVQDATDANTDGVTAQRLVFDSIDTAGSESARISTSIDELSVYSSGAIYIGERNDLELASLDTNGLIDIISTGNVSSAASLNSSGTLHIDAANIDLSGANTLSGALIFNGADVSVGNTVATDLGAISAQNLTVVSYGSITNSGVINVQSGLSDLTSSNGSISIVGNHDFGVVNLHAANDIVLDDINGITIENSSAGSNLTVTANSTYQAGDASIPDMRVGNITAGNTLTLNAGPGAILAAGSNGVSTPLTASTVKLRAGSGIGNGAADSTDGRGGAIFTNADTLSALNSGTTGTVKIYNSGDVIVQDLRNSGDIMLTNGGGNIILGVGSPDVGNSNPKVNMGAIDANYGASVEANVFPGSVVLLGVSGSENVYTMGSGPGVDIVAENLEVRNVKDFGAQYAPYPNPIRLLVHNKFSLFGSGTGVVTYSMNVEPKEIYSTADLVTLEGFVGLSGQQLIDLESLGEVDEAVFTAVRNYYYEDVAIMLPADQRMTDDEDEEDRRRRQAVN